MTRGRKATGWPTPVEGSRVGHVVHHEERAYTGALFGRQLERANEAERWRVTLAAESPLQRHPFGDHRDGVVHA
ncbi:MAG: hypothetical protein ABWZ16_12720 [Microbacterium sp.]